ncbi:uncharacterized protein METZ01_LOCUS480864 [marine metagenome]|uniref:Uncharacterized protein n=1 Tax=marine metagenome TaxID=408172 RepID=A0A383C7J6_9ZZZZ
MAQHIDPYVKKTFFSGLYQCAKILGFSDRKSCQVGSKLCTSIGRQQ